MRHRQTCLGRAHTVKKELKYATTRFGRAPVKTPTYTAIMVWGTNDIFFPLKWAYWQRDTIPGSKDVIELQKSETFLPDAQINALVVKGLEGSPPTSWAPGGSLASAGLRVTPDTFKPSASSSLTISRPTFPVAPVTKIIAIYLLFMTQALFLTAMKLFKVTPPPRGVGASSSSRGGFGGLVDVETWLHDLFLLLTSRHYFAAARAGRSIFETLEPERPPIDRQFLAEFQER